MTSTKPTKNAEFQGTVEVRFGINHDIHPTTMAASDEVNLYRTQYTNRNQAPITFSHEIILNSNGSRVAKREETNVFRGETVKILGEYSSNQIIDGDFVITDKRKNIIPNGWAIGTYDLKDDQGQASGLLTIELESRDIKKSRTVEYELVDDKLCIEAEIYN